MYKTAHISKTFQVSRQTVHTWCKEFAGFLSPNANPSDNSRRVLSDDDMRVLALVKDMTGQGKTYEAIHVTLASGQRGNLEIPSDIIPLPTQLEIAKQQLDDANQQIAQIEARYEQAKLDRAEALGQLKRANNEIDALKLEIRNLYKTMFAANATVKTEPDD